MSYSVTISTPRSSISINSNGTDAVKSEFFSVPSAGHSISLGQKSRSSVVLPASERAQSAILLRPNICVSLLHYLHQKRSTFIVFSNSADVPYIVVSPAFSEVDHAIGNRLPRPKGPMHAALRPPYFNRKGRVAPTCPISCKNRKHMHCKQQWADEEVPSMPNDCPCHTLRPAGQRRSGFLNLLSNKALHYMKVLQMHGLTAGSSPCTQCGSAIESIRYTPGRLSEDILLAKLRDPALAYVKTPTVFQSSIIYSSFCGIQKLLIS